MFKLMFKPHWILLTLMITFTSFFSDSFASPSFPIKNSSQPQTASPAPSPNLLQRRPRQRPGGRGDGSLCAIAPGLLERQNIIWNDRPLFLWNASSKVMLQQLELFDQSGKIVWQKSLAATAQSALYEGQPLQPGQFYTWRLYWTLQDAERTAGDANYTFQLMEPEQQQQIASELRTLARRLQASGEDAETVANQQADYLLTRSQPLWSDALKVLYTIENPSSQTTQKLQGWIDAACSLEGNGDAPIPSSLNP
jgi:hypothetical protein